MLHTVLQTSSVPERRQCLHAADDYHVEGTGLTKDEVTALLRGPAGLRVDLQVADAAGQPRHVSLERRSLPQPPVKEVRACLICGWCPVPSVSALTVLRSLCRC
jgi:C-terminal processing protease CtpA/Prc